MKTIFKSATVWALSVFAAIVSLHVLAGGSTSQASATQANARVSHRLIVKYRPNSLPAGLSVAQINEAMSRPLSATVMGQIITIAGAPLKELHALPHGAHVLALPSTPSRQVMDQTIAAIAALPDVEYVEEDAIMTIQLVPNDTNYNTGLAGKPALWAMQPVSPVASPAPGNTGNYGADFQTAWNTNTGTGVIVAVIDTGITPHDDIVGTGGTVSPATGNLVSPGYDFTTDCRIRGSCASSTPTGSATVAPSPNATDLGDFLSAADVTNFGVLGCPIVSPTNSSWHGTHVSGTIAAIGNNNANVIGGAFNAKILPVRVLGKCGGFLSDIANGILWAAGVHPTIANPDPAKVINMSLGGTGACGTTYQDAINAATAAGTTVVVAAGNSNADVANGRPANCVGVISVASIGRDGSRAYYSNFSSPVSNPSPVSVTLAAQGGDQSRPSTFDPGILSTLNSGTTTVSTPNLYYYQGTSMATPHVVATVALMNSRNRTLTPAQIKAILSSPSSLTSFPSFTGSAIVANSVDCATSLNCGAGILNAKLALQNSLPLTSSTSDFGLVALNVPTSLTLTLTNSTLQSFNTGVSAITGSNAALFSITSNACQNVTVNVGASCPITVRYTPVTSGSHSATLTIPTSEFTGVSTAIGLTGIGGASLTTSTPSVTAATVGVGQSTSVNLSFGNPNAFSVGVGSAILSNPTIMALSFNNCSNTTLTAGASCTMSVTVTPNALGNYSGTVSIGLAVGGTPTQASISGMASAPVAASGGGGGGGCTVMPAEAAADWSLLLVALLMLAYWLTRRALRQRRAD